MLLFSIDQAAFDALPADVQKEYKKRETDGKFVLDVQGAVAQEKLAEFRQNNIKLTKDLEKFEGVDVEKYHELVGMEKDIRAGKIKDGKTVEQIVEERVSEMKKAHDREKLKLTTDLEKANGQLSTLTIADAAAAAGSELGLRPTAREDLVGRVRQLFQLKDGKPVALNTEGAEIYGAGGEPMTIKEYVANLVEKAPHLFEASTGGGSKNGNGTGGGGKPTVNPWNKSTWNLTQQGAIFRANPDMARKMASEHGHTIAQVA